mmetsp:Transcript_34043/g.97327  ORF Transcript_34043/g.97327 Transcript_34043/m.97327 type:complete len:200 (+) Transcript_34043:2366-2965(+)
MAGVGLAGQRGVGAQLVVRLRLPAVVGPLGGGVGARAVHLPVLRGVPRLARQPAGAGHDAGLRPLRHRGPGVHDDLAQRAGGGQVHLHLLDLLVLGRVVEHPGLERHARPLDLVGVVHEVVPEDEDLVLRDGDVDALGAVALLGVEPQVAALVADHGEHRELAALLEADPALDVSAPLRGVVLVHDGLYGQLLLLVLLH